MHRFNAAGLIGLVTALALVAAGCGGAANNDNAPAVSGGNDAADTTGKRGGALTVLSIADVDSLDPGYWYYQYDYQALQQPTQRSLYGWEPAKTTPSPDLAAAMPETSPDGRTITIKLKPNIRYSAPLANRTVTSADVKYALERCFMPQVGNGYAGVYFSQIEGVKAYTAGKAKEITGIQTPDETTLVLRLTAPVGVLSNGQALSLPGSVPVPKDYAQKYDKGKVSTYGRHQVFTGPYMIANDGKGKLTGYTPGKEIELVRNPSWDASSDYRPAYADKITLRGGNDVGVASRRILSGKGLLSGDFAAPPTDVLKSALKTNQDQLNIEPSQGIRYISLNSKVKPFDNVNVRRAVSAVIDRNTLRLTRGGPTLGPTASHFLPPELPGFEAAGGLKGPGFDFVSNPDGDLKLAQEYMKKGGYPSGKYTGKALLMVGDNQPPASKTGEAVQSQLESLGFKLTYRQVSHPTMLSKFCQSPKAKVAICPNLGWGKDFFDSQSMLDPTANGRNIVQSNNVNTALIDDPKINALLDKATSETDQEARAKTYAQVDRMITDGAYYVPWLWDNQVNFTSKDVKGVRSKFNSAWDLSFSSLK